MVPFGRSAPAGADDRQNGPVTDTTDDAKRTQNEESARIDAVHEESARIDERARIEERGRVENAARPRTSWLTRSGPRSKSAPQRRPGS